MVLVMLRELYEGFVTMEVQQEEERAFSSMEEAEKWLKENSFVLGRRPFLNYRGGRDEWIQEDEPSWSYIDVAIKEYRMDDRSPSVFRNFVPRMAPWEYSDFIERNEEYKKQIEEIKSKHAIEKKPLTDK